MMILISNSEARLSSSVAIAVLHAVCLPATCTRHLAQLDGPSLHCMHVALQGQSSKEQRDERCVTPVCWTAKNGKKPITEAVIADYELPTFHMGGGMWNVRCRNIRHCPEIPQGLYRYAAPGPLHGHMRHYRRRYASSSVAPQISEASSSARSP